MTSARPDLAGACAGGQHDDQLTLFAGAHRACVQASNHISAEIDHPVCAVRTEPDVVCSGSVTNATILTSTPSR